MEATFADLNAQNWRRQAKYHPCAVCCGISQGQRKSRFEVRLPYSIEQRVNEFWKKNNCHKYQNPADCGAEIQHGVHAGVQIVVFSRKASKASATDVNRSIPPSRASAPSARNRERTDERASTA